MLAITALFFATAVYLVAFHLPLFADFSFLLPQDAPAVRDLHRLEARTKTKDADLVIVVAPDATSRAAAASEMATGLRALPNTLIDRLDVDDNETREFLRAHRHLFVPLEDLRSARDALARRITAAKLKANPHYINLDDDDDAPAKPAAGTSTPDAKAPVVEDAQARADRDQLDKLRKRRKDAEAKLDKSSYISADGTTALITVKTAFRQTNVTLGSKLLEQMGIVSKKVMAAHPGVFIGFAGGISTTVAEHNALLRGMVLSSIITGVLVGLVLAVFFRSATLLGLLTTCLLVATTVTFGVAALTIGHLNAATAFLGAIIAGNGVNYGILLIARYLEERRRHNLNEALTLAIVGTIKPTGVASLGASIAYGSLAATSFRGFADFAWIGAIGMALCWVVTYLVLPAMMLRFGRYTRIYQGSPRLGNTLAWMFGFRKPAVVLAVTAALTIGASVIVYRYIAADPFEYNIRKLRSEGADAINARHWMDISDKNFGRGISGKTYIAADRPDQVQPIIDALRKVDAKDPVGKKTIGTTSSILDVMPLDQAERVVVLGEIRKLLDDDALGAMSDDERKEMSELRPPDDLKAITPADLPRDVTEMLQEKDGRIGLLIAIRPALELDEWDGRDLIRFSDAVRRLTLKNGETVTTSGSSVIFADIVAAIRNDGGRVTGVASLGLILMVLLVVGSNRRGVAVLTGTLLGSLAMVATCALLGLKVNFLDFVALPITLGLGVDYAINIAHRQASESDDSPATTLRTSGSAVFVCSLTTIIGYGSLLVSDNLAIRGFGVASLIGEITCLLAALALVPTLVSWLGHRRKRS